MNTALGSIHTLLQRTCIAGISIIFYHNSTQCTAHPVQIDLASLQYCNEIEYEWTLSGIVALLYYGTTIHLLQTRVLI